MLTQEKLNRLGNFYKKDLERRGRVFNRIKFQVKKTKSANSFGMATMSNYTRGYDIIQINQYLVDEDELINTILHELAHLDKEAYGHKHGPAWKRVAAMYSRWYNTKITTTSDKVVMIPGAIKVNVVWNEKCLRRNPKVQKNWSKVFTSETRLNTFIRKYKNIDYIESYTLEKLS